MSDQSQDFPQPVVAEGGALFSNRGKMLVALVVLLGAFGYLAVMAFQSATVYYYTVGELQEIVFVKEQLTASHAPSSAGDSMPSSSEASCVP